MEWFQGGLADPPYANMSTTYMATFFVIALLVGGLFLARGRQHTVSCLTWSPRLNSPLPSFPHTNCPTSPLICYRQAISSRLARSNR